jgi:hypothetical protein
VLCCAVLCCAVLCCAVLCCAVLCCAVLCCADSHAYATKADGKQTNDLEADESEMMLADLILGNTVTLDRDTVPGMKPRIGGRLNDGTESKLRVPPFLNSTPPLYEGGSGPKYNTVEGFCQTDMRNPDGTWGKNPACPRSKVWSE